MSFRSSRSADHRPKCRSGRGDRKHGSALARGVGRALVLLWQHILGLELHWMVLAMSVIQLLAVGSDYDLLLVSRFEEEVHGR